MREWLIEERRKKDLTQEETASKLGISTTYYCYIEKGERQKSLDLSLAKKIADLFCLEIAQIVKFEADLRVAEA